MSRAAGTLRGHNPAASRAGPNRQIAYSVSTPDMSTPLQALLVEDSSLDAELLLNALARDGFVVEHKRVQTPGDLLAALDARSWDVVLCDYVLPAITAPEAIRLVRQRNIDVPMIIISGTIGE